MRNQSGDESAILQSPSFARATGGRPVGVHEEKGPLTPIAELVMGRLMIGDSSSTGIRRGLFGETLQPVPSPDEEGGPGEEEGGEE